MSEAIKFWLAKELVSLGALVVIIVVVGMIMYIDMRRQK